MKRYYTLLLLVFACGTSIAQPTGWSGFQAFTVTNNTTNLVLGYQMPIIFNSQTLIASSQMQASGADIRFGAACNSATFFPHYIDSGLNTANTRAFVKIDTLLPSASRTIYLFYGNPTAATTSTVTIFNGPYSSTNQVTGGTAGGMVAGGCQRGFRFTPNVNILVTQFGKNEPTGTTRYVTLFDFTTQAIIRQMQVSGVAASYVYSNLPQTVWLNSGTQYILELSHLATDGYYFGTSTQINANLTYGDMRYCNSCNQNTFPTTILAGYHYGYPDFNFYTQNSVTPAPTVVSGGSGGVAFSPQPANVSTCIDANATFTASVTGNVLSYQWQVLNGTTWTNLTNTPPYSNVTTNTLTITAVTAGLNGMQYRLSVVSNCGASNSNAATLSIDAAPTSVITYSSPLSFCDGGAVVLNTYSGAGLTYEWQFNGSPIPGANGTSTTATQSGAYSVKVIKTAGCFGLSPAVTVKVNPVPQPVITFAGNILSTANYFTDYQWYFNNQPIPSATSYSYNFAPTGYGGYRVFVTDTNGCKAASPAMYISITGINQAVTGGDIRIYPNPVTDIVHIDAPVKVNVVIRDPQGKDVMQQNDAKSINLQPLSAGIYMMYIRDTHGNLITTEKITKTR